MFAGMIVVVNFFFILIVLPSTLVIYDKLENKCCKRAHKDKEDAFTYSLEDQYSGIDRFFGEKFNNIFTFCVVRWYFFIIFIGWTMFAAYMDQNKEFQTYVPEFVPEDHPAAIAKM